MAYVPNLVAIGENETYAISTGPLHVDQRDLESVSRAGYSTEEILHWKKIRDKNL